MDKTAEVVTLGASSERRVRSAAAALLFALFAAYFLYDGFVGYPRRNVEALQDTLNPRPPVLPPTRNAVHPRLVRQFPVGSDPARLRAVLGPPTWQAGGEQRWFGPSGCLRVVTDADQLISIEWVYGPYKDVYLQRWIGFVLLAVTAGFVVQFIRVLLTRAVLGADGIFIRGHRRFSYEEILSLATDSWTTDGTIDLEIQHLKGNPTDHAHQPKPFVLRLDAYTYSGLPLLVEHVCARRGWVVPDAIRAAPSSAKEAPASPARTS